LQTFISICIPAYKRVNYLKRLLDSIAIQSYKNFEIIISDDSPDDSVKDLTEEYKNLLPLIYFKNEKSLGTPANWNFGISKAKGEWIKLMHDDDWFSSPKSLEIFASKTSDGSKFIFSAYTNIFENSNSKEKKMFMPFSWQKKMVDEPAVLFAQNVIGPPSVTLIHRSIKEVYDERLKWRVDLEFYMRIIKSEKKFTYIDETLISVGVSESQVTQSCIYEPNVELPEGYILLQKHGTDQLKNILVYDAWWRLLRNMDIKSKAQLQQYEPHEWPAIILNMVNDLSKVSKNILKIGVFSKLLMFASYKRNFSKK